MYPLNREPTLKYVVTRTAHADSVDTVVVAASTEPTDDVVEQYAPTFAADVIRGSESNVLGRFEPAIETYDPDVILRITCDCPLIDPTTVDTVAAPVSEGNADYASNIGERTFPRGLDVEAFSYESFQRVISAATTQVEREHVTPYYLESSQEFETVNISSREVFETEQYADRADLRLPLDIAAGEDRDDTTCHPGFLIRTVGVERSENRYRNSVAMIVALGEVLGSELRPGVR